MSKKDKEKNRGYHRSSASSSSTDYKELYKELKHDLKRRNREIEDLEDECSKYTRESKKAKQDTQDLWKIYSNMQTELQQSFERNAKLQAEKCGIEAVLDQERREHQKQKASKTEQDIGKLRDALIAMQKEKLEFQGKYNGIVLENKNLREKETTYEPRLREMENLKTKLEEMVASYQSTLKDYKDLQREFSTMAVNKDKVEKYRRWNSLLMMETQQKADKMRSLGIMERNFDAMKAECQAHRQKMLIKEKEALELRQELKRIREFMKVKIARVNTLLRQLKMDQAWNKDAVNADFNRWRMSFAGAFHQLQSKVDVISKDATKINRLPITKTDSSSSFTGQSKNSVSDAFSLGYFAPPFIPLLENILEQLHAPSLDTCSLREKVSQLQPEITKWDQSLAEQEEADKRNSNECSEKNSSVSTTTNPSEAENKTTSSKSDLGTDGQVMSDSNCPTEKDHKQVVSDSTSSSSTIDTSDKVVAID